MIGIIILNYKTWEMTTQCVDSIIATYKEPFTIYIVDNGSGNGSFERLTKLYQQQLNIKVILSENYGYAKGNNIGVREAIKDGCNYILIANNDVIFLDDSISEMIHFLRNNPAAVASPYILSPTENLQNVPTKKQISLYDYLFLNTKLRYFATAKRKHQFDEDHYLNEIEIGNQPIKIYKFSGCCFMVKSKEFENVGLFDEETFLYYEEDILCKKLEDAGYKSYFLPNAKIVHHHGLTTGKDNLFVDTEMFKSELYFLAKVYHLPSVILFFVYWDRALTPIMKKIKKQYNLSFKEYQKFLSETWKRFIKYTTYK